MKNILKDITRMTFIAVFGIALLCAVSISRVEAVLILTLDDLSTVGEEATIVSDINLVLYSGLVGDFNTTMTFGTDLGFEDIDLFLSSAVTYLDTDNSGDGVLVITLTETDISSADDAYAYTTGFGETDQNVTVEFYIDVDNSLGEFDGLDWHIDYEDDFLLDDVDLAGLEEDYSITIVATITLADGTATGFTSEVQPVPEPATIALLGIGLVGLVGAGIRKQKDRNKKS